MTFESATLSGGMVNFIEAMFSDGTVNFLGMRCADGMLNFDRATGPAPNGLLTAVGTPVPSTVSLPAAW
ncbi:hypothetical protein [Streptomyces sp. NPDC005989]|uniref:hypothetical protein n=1 Tax=Streptomyces sp. NPDC005989 TaxID=3156727 RepID=UPI0034051CCB